MANLLTSKEVSKQLNASLVSVYRWAKSGVLPSVRIGGAVRFSAEALEKFIEQGGTQAVDQRAN